MKFSDIRKIRAFCKKLDSTPAWRDVVGNITSGKIDFDVDGVRFISEQHIDRIQQNELKSDLYVLGCFNALFLADVLDIDQDVIDSMQKAEAYEAIGKLIISMNKLATLQEGYASADGYGHHFNYYDGGEDTIDTPHGLFYVFDNH